MADKYYYIKRESDIVGPFSTAQIMNMIQEQILSRDTMLSENRIYWNTAEEILFPKKEVPKTTIFSVPKPKKEKTVEKEKVILKDEEAVPFILPEKNTEKSVSKNIPDPVSATFSMIWNAPQYLKNMESLKKFKQAAKTTQVTQTILEAWYFVKQLPKSLLSLVFAKNSHWNVRSGEKAKVHI